MKNVLIFVLLFGAAVLSLFLFWRTFYDLWQFLALRDWIFVILGIVALASSIVLSMILLGQKMFLLLSLGICGIFAALFHISLFYFISLAFFLICLFFGYQNYEYEAKTRTKMEIFWMVSRVLPIILTGISLIVAMSYQSSPAFGRMSFEIQIPRVIFDEAWTLIPKEMTNTFLSGNQNLFGPTYGAEPPDAKQNQLGVPPARISPKAESKPSISENEAKEKLYQEINSFINSWIDQNLGAKKQQYFSIFVVVGLFLGLQALTIPLSWVISFLVWIIMKILFFFKVAKIEKIMVEKEILTM